MKKLLLLCLLGAGAFTAAAQDQGTKCPPAEGTPAMVVQTRANALDFTTTFSDGTTTVNLFTVLDAGKTVLLDFFYAT